MVAILLGTGFEEMEALAPCNCLRRANVSVLLVGLTDLSVTGAHGICVQADCTLAELDVSALEMIVLPGGMGGVHAICDCPEAMQLIQNCYASGKLVAAICAAPTVLAALHITDGKKATCYPGMEPLMRNAIMQHDQPVVQDGTVITSTAAGTAMEFALYLVQVLQGKETALQIKKSLVYHCR